MMRRNLHVQPKLLNLKFKFDKKIMAGSHLIFLPAIVSCCVKKSYFFVFAAGVTEVVSVAAVAAPIAVVSFAAALSGS
jgi:hypothetical protein